MSQTYAISATEATFQEVVLGSSMPVVVDFWAEWCPPCRALAPFIDKFACEYSGVLTVVKVDYDQSQALAEQYGIDSIPRLLFFHQGKLVSTTLAGIPEYPELKRLFEQFAAQSAGVQAAEPSAAEQAFAQAVALAEAAENDACTPGIMALQEALEPINDRYQSALEAAAAELGAGTITQAVHDSRCAAASAQRQTELSPEMRKYMAVRVPAQKVFIAAIEVAVRQFAAAIAANK